MIVGSGIDVIEISRIERALARSGPRFETRVFTAAEIAECRRHRHPAPHFALRFAAKEAAMKAVGTGWAQGVRWVDIETLRPGAARDVLSLALHGRVGELATARGACAARLAVGRSRSHAVALVLLEGRAR